MRTIAYREMVRKIPFYMNRGMSDLGWRQFKKIKIRRILVIFWGRIGELVLSTMLLRLIRKKYKNAHITYIIGGKGAQLFKKEIFFDSAIPANMGIYKILAKEKPYDLAIDLFGRQSSGLFARLSGARYRIFYSPPCPRVNVNTVGIRTGLKYKAKNVKDHFLFIARVLGIDTKYFDTVKPCLGITEGEKHFAINYLQKLNIKERDFVVGLQPGGNYELWPTKKYAELGNWLINNYQAKVLIFQGKGEESIAQNVWRLMCGQAILLPGLKIRDYISILSQCKFLVTNIGGAAHVAPALGVPAVVILTNKEADYWIPNCKKGFYMPLRSKTKLVDRNLREFSRRGFELTASVKRVYSLIESKNI